MATAWSPAKPIATQLVLYVEDNAADARLAAEALAEVGCPVRLEVVENAVQAFEFLANRGRFVDRGVPDLILLDLQLPIIGGHQALGVLRSHERWRRIPVQVITSSAQDSDRHISESLGARFATKPRSWREYLAWAAVLRDQLAAQAGSPPVAPASQPAARQRTANDQASGL